MVVGIVIMLLFLLGCGGNNMENRKAVFETNLGTFTIELFEDKMPVTTNNFIDLAEKGFYDGTRFHRVIKSFMNQGGDPLSKDLSQQARWGTGGPGYAIEDEFHDDLSNVRGTIAMANAGPNSGGSQFFINVVDNTFLDHNKQPPSSKHPVFGKVVDGMDIIDKINGVQTASGDKPVEEILVVKVRIE